MNKFIKIAISFTFLVLSAKNLKADHIVGGHIELKAVGNTPGKFRIIMKLYFNALNPNSEIPSTVEDIGISKKSNNESIDVMGLRKTKEIAFEYSNEDCAKLNKLKILEVTYENDWEVNPQDFQDPAGYYIYHDRCCRNAGISNIPNSNLASMAFYTEFPPMIRNGKPFLNSTPSFSILSGEYICRTDPFKYNFNAIDADGDSLRYILATPLQGKSTPQNTRRMLSGPFSGINWQTGYGINNIIPGSPTLAIDSRKGILTVTPTELGLFVFSVICEEYRKIGGVYVKLGITQRDFQLKVIDCPIPTNLPDPAISVIGRPGTDPTICFGDKVTFKSTVNPNWSYQWEFDGDNLPNANYDTLTATRPGTYSLIVSLKNQCTKSRTSRQITLKVLNDNVKLKMTGKSFCEGEKAILEAPLSGTNFKYKWYKNGQTLAINSNIEKIEVTQSGQYFVAISNDNTPTACPSVSDTASVKVFTKPEAVISSTNNTNLICSGDNLELNANIGDKYTYQWFLDGISISKANNNTYIASLIGNYTVEVADSNFCKSLSIPLKIDSVTKVSISLDSIPPICDLNKGTIPLKGTPSGGVFKGLGVTNNVQGIFDPKIIGLGEHTVSYEYTGLLQCQSGIAQRKIIISEPFKLNLTPKEFYIVKGTSASLVAPNFTGFKYQWSPDNTLSNAKTASPIARPTETQTYTLVLTTDKGCISQDTVKVNVTQKIWIPNIFTPNGDSQNDTWTLTGIETYQDAEVSIYNRWGEMVFYSKGYSIPFDGTYKNEPLPIDTYVYKVFVPSKDFLYNGTFMLAR